jgi:hypothetical protein
MRRDARLTTAALMPPLCKDLPTNLDFLSERAHLPAMQRHVRKGERIVITKPMILATSMMALVAVSGHAYAGTTISDKRYWPSEARLSQTVVRQPESAFGAAMAQLTVGHRHGGGGPKSAY